MAPRHAGRGVSQTISGRLVLDDRVEAGVVVVDEGFITDVDCARATAPHGPVHAPGFVDVHVHGWGGHDAMGDEPRSMAWPARSCARA